MRNHIEEIKMWIAEMAQRINVVPVPM